MDQPDIIGLVQRMRSGDRVAREALVSLMYERLVKLSRTMLRKGSPAVQRWEQTEDLAHAAWFRIQRALEDDRLSFTDEVHLFRVAARHIRFELIDLYRKHTGVQGLATNHHTSRENESGFLADAEGQVDGANTDPSLSAAWGDFHQMVESLPEKEKTIVDLLWYQGLKQPEAASLLGVDVKTVKRRWRDAKVRLADALDARLVDDEC